MNENWFSEHCPMWEGMALSVQIKSKLYEALTPFQKIEVFETATYGNMLVLDDKIQCTERDEFAYHDMLVHPALYAHPNPQNVLIIGGGDGGAIREVLKHDCVCKCELCEIDREVSNVAQKFLPRMGAGLTHPKAELHYADGIDYLRNTHNKYDVIIVDSSDPFGPAEVLYGAPFYQLIAEHLNENGIVAAQSGFFFIHEPTVRELREAIQANFKHYAYLFAHCPSYPGGGVGIALGTQSDCIQLNHPLRAPTMKHPYYTPDIHFSASVLPAFAQAEGHA